MLRQQMTLETAVLTQKNLLHLKIKIYEHEFPKALKREQENQRREKNSVVGELVKINNNHLTSK